MNHTILGAARRAPAGLLAVVTMTAMAAMAGLVGCGSGEPEAEPVQRTERQRDSLIGESILPGAGGVRRALRASDSAAARNARLDSIANSN